MMVSFRLQTIEQYVAPAPSALNATAIAFQMQYDTDLMDVCTKVQFRTPCEVFSAVQIVDEQQHVILCCYLEARVG